MAHLTLKTIVPYLLATMLIVSCSSSQKISVAARDDIKGNWTLDRITYDGLATSDKVKITLLDEGDEACLINSTWALPNNGNGSYTLVGNSPGCTPGQRNIVWSYQKTGGQPYFQYKILPGGVKAKQITDGYRLKITSFSKGNFTAQTEVAFEGKSIFINYSFSKR